MTARIRISEIFGPTVQGEGPLIGKPTVFVRTGGCDYRCTWCDTLYAVLPEYRNEWTLQTPAEIMARVNDLAGSRPVLVSLSGGNPALQPLGDLIALGRSHGHRFALETQGSVAQPWFADLDWLIVSPKPPSSGMTTDWEVLGDTLAMVKGETHGALKVVVFDDADYDYAKGVAARFPAFPIYLQPGKPAPLYAAGKPMPEAADGDDLAKRLRWLIEKVTSDRWFEATVLPQLHVIVWGNKRGV